MTKIEFRNGTSVYVDTHWISGGVFYGRSNGKTIEIPCHCINAVKFVEKKIEYLFYFFIGILTGISISFLTYLIF